MFSVLKGYFWSVAGFAAAAWFAFFSVEGRYGLVALETARSRLAETSTRLEDMRAERRRLEAQNAMLDGPAPDRDLVEERARAVLKFAHPDDVILTRAELDRLIGARDRRRER